MISESLSTLIHFIIEHDYHIIQKLSRPRLINNRKYMYLGNNALEQLNIISKDRDEMTVLKLIDKTSTAIGKRLLKERLVNPIMQEDELNRRYNLIEKVHSHVNIMDENLRAIYDLERLSRRIKLARLHPFEVNYVYDSLLSVKDLMNYVRKHKIQKCPFSESEIDEFIREIEKSFDLDTSRRFTTQSVDENFLRRGVDSSIDMLVDENMQMLSLFDRIMESMESMINVHVSSTAKYVTLGLLKKRGTIFHSQKINFPR